MKDKDFPIDYGEQTLYVEEASFNMPYKAIKELYKYLFDRYDDLPDGIKEMLPAWEDFLIENY